MNFKNRFRVNATMISNEFIDQYMPHANGEYVKEYLFLMRHEGEEVTVSMIADALNHTEADVSRALTYWKKAGVLVEIPVDKPVEQRAASEIACAEVRPQTVSMSAANLPERQVNITPEAVSVVSKNSAVSKNSVVSHNSAVSQNPAVSQNSAVPQNPAEEEVIQKPAPRPVYSMDQISNLAGDEDFSQLLYIAQKYMNKVFTQRECEVFAYLYDGLHMTAEMLEYVVEYCVQGGHTSIRYIETVALDWNEKGLKTIDEAKAYASAFSKDTFAVMKAFGLNDRKPGDSEREIMERWFRTYNFTKELVLEACNRTMEAIHSPSFKYADKILSEWKKAGVRTFEDIKRLDEQHAERTDKNSSQAAGRSGKSGGYQSGASKGKQSRNQFTNFPQREIDYDALILKQLSEQ